MPGPIRGGFFYLYLMLDIFSRKIVGWEVHERESAELAANLVRRAVWAEGCLIRPLVLHADNGSPMKGATMKATLERLGVIASYSRPRVSDDNPFSEALFRTCKYRPDWPTSGFASKEDAQRWVAGFVSWYNNEHRHSAIRFVTPNARHTGEDRALLERRTRLYTEARAANPARWSRQIRNWSPVGDVCLNPERDTNHRKIRDAA
jgi:transposase InsO family protein